MASDDGLELELARVTELVVDSIDMECLVDELFLDCDRDGRTEDDLKYLWRMPLGHE